MKKTKSKAKAKIKPILRSHFKRNNFSKWVISHFPENYTELIYVDPYCGGLNVLLNKNKSYIEVINDNDKLILEIYRSLRNEYKEFVKRINKYKFCEDTFLKIKLSQEKEDYLEAAVNDYLLRGMSKLELKTKFSKNNFKNWKSDIKNLVNVSSRINETFILSNKALDVIKDFDFKDTLLFCDPPHLYETKKGKTVYMSDMPVDEHISLSHALNSFSGKVILSGVISPLYNRLYKNWSLFKSKYKGRGGKVEVIWKNF